MCIGNDADKETKMEKTCKIKFGLYSVTNGMQKARVHYSLDNHIGGIKCVTIYACDYMNDLAKIMSGCEYVNNTEIQTDYFEKGTVRIYESDAMYAEARAAVESVVAKLNAKRSAAWAKKMERYEAKRAAIRAA
jgi:hypothetical protein